MSTPTIEGLRQTCSKPESGNSQQFGPASETPMVHFLLVLDCTGIRCRVKGLEICTCGAEPRGDLSLLGDQMNPARV